MEDKKNRGAHTFSGPIVDYTPIPANAQLVPSHIFHSHISIKNPTQKLLPAQFFITTFCPIYLLAIYFSPAFP